MATLTRPTHFCVRNRANEDERRVALLRQGNGTVGGLRDDLDGGEEEEEGKEEGAEHGRDALYLGVYAAATVMLILLSMGRTLDFFLASF